MLTAQGLTSDAGALARPGQGFLKLLFSCGQAAFLEVTAGIVCSLGSFQFPCLVIVTFSLMSSPGVSKLCLLNVLTALWLCESCVLEPVGSLWSRREVGVAGSEQSSSYVVLPFLLPDGIC